MSHHFCQFRSKINSANDGWSVSPGEAESPDPAASGLMMVYDEFSVRKIIELTFKFHCKETLEILQIMCILLVLLHIFEPISLLMRFTLNVGFSFLCKFR